MPVNIEVGDLQFMDNLVFHANWRPLHGAFCYSTGCSLQEGTPGTEKPLDASWLHETQYPGVYHQYRHAFIALGNLSQTVPVQAVLANTFAVSGWRQERASSRL